MLKLLHTADWQLGASSPLLGAAAEGVARQRFATARRVVALAHEQSVELVLIAGDTFEHSDVDESVVREGVDLLNELAPIPAVLLPGNHDPLTPGGIWDRRSFVSSIGDHVHLAREAAPLRPVDGVTVLPCPLSQKQSRQDPTAWIPAREAGDGDLRIGLAHGSLDTLAKPGNFPISPKRVEEAGLDYLALGDWHGLRVFDRVAYPGTIEATGFSERKPGHVLVVRLTADVAASATRGASRGTVEIEPVSVAELEWLEVRRELEAVADVDRLQRELLEEREPRRLVVRLRLETSGAETEEAAQALLRRLEASACFVDAQIEERLESGDALPAGLLREVDDVLAGMTTPTGADPALLELADLPGGRHEDSTVLAEARRQLRRLAERFGA